MRQAQAQLVGAHAVLVERDELRTHLAGLKEKMGLLEQQISQEHEREALWHQQLQQVEPLKGLGFRHHINSSNRLRLCIHYYMHVHTYTYTCRHTSYGAIGGGTGARLAEAGVCGRTARARPRERQLCAPSTACRV
jgi:hypothetical protein